MATENTYWSNNGTHQAIIEQLQALIPAEGPVKNPYKNKALEKFRKASNAYYRLYNDGDFNSGKGRMFGIEYISRFSRRVAHMGGYHTEWGPGLYEEVEKGMDRIIEAAAKEQGIELK